MKSDVTYLGLVINVNTSVIEVEISSNIPSSAPIIHGRMYRLGQIGTLVKILIGNLRLYGLVSSVSNAPSHVDTNTIEPNYGSRFIQVQLIGEQLGSLNFERGIGTFPTINDEVHIVTEDDLKTIYGNHEDGLIEVGKHASSENLSVYLDLHNLVLRHSATLGSTGSGKSNTTAHILRKILNEKMGSRIVLVDIHGEYDSAFGTDSIVFRINDPTQPLNIPLGYDSDNAILEVEFKSNGQVWQYYDVPQYVYEEMMGGGSIGKYFHANVLKQYREGRV